MSEDRGYYDTPRGLRLLSREEAEKEMRIRRRIEESKRELEAAPKEAPEGYDPSEKFFSSDEGYYRGNILPYRENLETGKKEFATPAILANPLRSAIRVGAAARGEIDPSNLSYDDVMNATGLAGGTSFGLSRAVGPQGGTSLGMFVGPRAHGKPSAALWEAQSGTRMDPRISEVASSTRRDVTGKPEVLPPPSPPAAGGVDPWASVRLSAGPARQTTPKEYWYEISDQGASLRPGSTTPGNRVILPLPFKSNPTVPLQDLLHHPELFAAYPHLKDFPVRYLIQKDLEKFPAALKGAQGAYNYDSIWVKPEKFPTQDELLSVFLHEVQHAIQHHEGRIFNRDQGVSHLPEWQAYRFSPTELEARQVQARRGMTEAERIASPPDYEDQIVKGYAEGGSIMNPFQGYAYGYSSPYEFSPVTPRAMEPSPVYAPRDAGYMGIYGTPPTKDVSPGVASVLEGLRSDAIGGPAGEGGNSDMPAGERAASGPALGTGYNMPGTLGSVVGALSGVPFGGAIGGALGAIAGANRANTDLTALGVGPAVDAGKSVLSSMVPGVIADIFGLPTNQQQFNQAVVSRMSPDDYMSRTASLTGQGTIPGYDLNVQPGQGGPGTPGSDPTPDTSNPDPAPGDRLARGGYVPGQSGGMDDDVPAIIDGKGPARLSSGEFVFDAATVAALGDGNNQAGARKLDGLRKAIRKKAYGHEKQPPKNYSVGDLVRLYDRR